LALSKFEDDMIEQRCHHLSQLLHHEGILSLELGP
jgi:hypothetical protein